MTQWLLDTNVLSELRRPRPEPAVVSFISKQKLEDLFVSSVTFAEIRFGIELQGDLDKRAALHEWLAHKLRPMFAGRVLPITEDVMLRWRILVEHGRKKGYTFSQPDLIIAATAAEYGLTVLSRDQREYQQANVPVVSPWAAK